MSDGGQEVPRCRVCGAELTPADNSATCFPRHCRRCTVISSMECSKGRPLTVLQRERVIARLDADPRDAASWTQRPRRRRPPPGTG